MNGKSAEAEREAEFFHVTRQQPLHDSATGRIAIYYGCADTCVGIAYGYLDDMIAEMQDAAQ